jgi:hypothetical protein
MKCWEGDVEDMPKRRTQCQRRMGQVARPEAGPPSPFPPSLTGACSFRKVVRLLVLPMLVRSAASICGWSGYEGGREHIRGTTSAASGQKE